MKNILIRLLGGIFAVLLAKLSIANKEQTGSYVWYPIKLDVHIACLTNLNIVNTIDLEVDSRYLSIVSFNVDVAEVTFDESGNPAYFACDEINEEICAVGYVRPITGSAGFHVEFGKWVPDFDNTPVVHLCRSQIY